MIVTFFRPFAFANSKAARAIRADPLRVLILQETAKASAGSDWNGENAGASFARIAESSAGTGENSTPAERSFVFSRKTTRASPSLKLRGFPGYALQGLRQTYRSKSCRIRTPGER